MLRELRSACREILESAGIEDADYEISLIAEHVTGMGRASQLANAAKELPKAQSEEIIRISKKRALRYPLQYLLGRWSFRGIELEVGEGVLIPRDDTEVVFSLCEKYLRGRPKAEALDLCSGSGALALALGIECRARVTAVELSDEAFYFLEKNINKFKDISAVTPFHGDIFTCHGDFPDGGFDLIVSNPPYIRTGELKALQPEVQNEPEMALDGGESGLDFYRAIIARWSQKLKSGGALAFELGEDQADEVGRLMREQGFSGIKTALDFSGVQRAIIGTML